MYETEAELRKWGRSIGVVIPKEAVNKEHLKAGQTIKVIISKKTKFNPLRETFGKLKLKKSTAKIMREIDKELYND